MTFKAKLLITALTFILLSCTTGVKSNDDKAENVQAVVLEPNEFKSKLDSTPDAVLIDVRTPEEFSEGIIAGAVNMDFKAPDFSEKIRALDKNKKYFVYCLSGKRSNSAIEIMEDAGFKNLYTLKDGLQRWTEDGLQTVKP